MVRPIKKKKIPNLQEAIKETAWKQIAKFGAPALSLRAIARELKITAPAIYNYFPSRDELVTALIVDAFTSLGDSQKSVLEANADQDGATRLSRLGLAYRDWAVSYPQRYQLIFGTPLPNYDAPDEVTLPAAAWALVPLIEMIQALFVEGSLRVERLEKRSTKLTEMLKEWQGFIGQNIEVEVLYLALVIWSRVHGLVMLELGHQMPSFINNPGEVFRREISNILIQYL